MLGAFGRAPAWRSSMFAPSAQTAASLALLAIVFWAESGLGFGLALIWCGFAGVFRLFGGDMFSTPPPAPMRRYPRFRHG
jgi:hypothetical protein